MKKIMAAILSALLIVSMTGCKDEKSEYSLGDINADKAVIDIVESGDLTEDKMERSVRDYYDVYNAVFTHTGEDIKVEVVIDESGRVNINSTSQGQTKTVLSWDSIIEAFSYLYEQGQLSLDGKVLFDKDSAIKALS